MKRDIHTRINMRPQIVKAIYAAAKIKGENFKTVEFSIYAAIRANRMMLFY
jgi:hypothetical protein